LFAALVGLRDEVNLAFIFDFRRTCVFFANDFSGFKSSFDSYVKVGFQIFWQKRLPKNRI